MLESRVIEVPLMLGAAAEWALRPDGLIHLVQDGHDLPRGPLGALLYLLFVPFYWWIQPSSRTGYLIATSLVLAFLTLGPAYMAAVLGLSLLGLIVLKTCARPDRLAAGIALLSVVYVAWIVWPQPRWLPPVQHPLYFYLHWAGIGYIFLKSVHVLVEVAKGRLVRPAARDYIAYLLFAPTLRMGPIYRYPEFEAQLHDDPRRYRDLGAAAIRITVGLVRLGLMAVMLDNFPIAGLFEEPWTLPTARFLGTMYAAPLSIYLWISGYVDLSIGVGIAMGFRVPENFRYPWRSISLAEFWRRWHLTLGAWLRDYVYIPLGGSRRHVFFNYFVTFLFCGVWHGLYVSYVCWGISQGVGLGLGRLWNQYWTRQREAATPLYARLARWKLAGSPLTVAAAWLLTFHYQILTIVWFMDENHAGRRVFARLWEILWC